MTRLFERWFMLPEGALLVSKSFKRFVLDIMGWLWLKSAFIGSTVLAQKAFLH